MNDIPLDLTGLPTDLTCNQEELEKWLDDTSVPLSDEEMKAMSVYFDSESFQFPDDSVFGIINIDNKILKR